MNDHDIEKFRQEILLSLSDLKDRMRRAEQVVYSGPPWNWTTTATYTEPDPTEEDKLVEACATADLRESLVECMLEGASLRSHLNAQEVVEKADEIAHMLRKMREEGA